MNNRKLLARCVELCWKESATGGPVIGDYRAAYKLPDEGVFSGAIDDLPDSARKLFDIISKYLTKRVKPGTIPMEKIVFERKEILRILLVGLRSGEEQLPDAFRV